MIPPNGSPLQFVLGRLTDIQKQRGGWSAKCPAHDDTSPSLSVGQGRAGRVLLYCHAGCPITEIVARMGLTMQDLFPPKDL